MTLIPTLTFTELRVVSIEHWQQVWHASRERLPFRTPGSIPHGFFFNYGEIYRHPIPTTCLQHRCMDAVRDLYR